MTFSKMVEIYQMGNEALNLYRIFVHNPTTGKISITEVEALSVEDAQAKVMKTQMPYVKLLKVSIWVNNSSLPEKGYWDICLQSVNCEVDGRVETGPLKVNEDWCGYYIRGDNAVGMSIDANEVERWFNSLPDIYRKKSWIHMNNILTFLKSLSSCRNK
jgi:hypothetical protein